MLRRVINKIKRLKNEKIKKQKLLKSEKFKNLYSNLNKKIFYLDTPEHGNLGDQMIAIAGEKLIKSMFSNYNYVEFSSIEYDLIKIELTRRVKKNDIIIIHGGGNFGTLYFKHEIRRRDIVKRFPNNKIIFMPQTITYEGKRRNKELEKTQSILREHEKLSILCREEKSFLFAKEVFSRNNIFLTPDTVNYLEGYGMKIEKKQDVLFLLRKDKEKVSDDEKINKIINFLEINKISYKKSDTHVGDKEIYIGNRVIETEKLLKDIKESKLIITDRLHGMILSIINGKSTLAFNSLDGKVKKSYDTWYKNYFNVDFLEKNIEMKEIEEIIKNKLKEETLKIKTPTKEKLIKIFKEEILNNE